MTTRYEVRLAGRVVSTRDATSARQAASDYVRSLGCRADEIIAVAADAVAWRGAVYRAAPLSTATSSSSSNSFSGQRPKKRAELIQFSQREAALQPKGLEHQVSSVGGPTIVRESLSQGELFAKL